MIIPDFAAAHPDLVVAISDRTDGTMSVKSAPSAEVALENRERFLGQLAITTDRLVLAAQTHGTVVEKLMPSDLGLAASNSSPFDSADGLLITEPNLYGAIFFADCMPIFLIDPLLKQAVAVHAGWRGIANGSIATAVQCLTQAGSNLKDLKIWIGPHIRSCHYKIDRESEGGRAKLAAFGEEAEIISERDGQLFLDLTGLAVRQLESTGLSKGQIIDSQLCTACQTDRFFSYHASNGQPAGQMMAVLGWRPTKDT